MNERRPPSRYWLTLAQLSGLVMSPVPDYPIDVPQLQSHRPPNGRRRRWPKGAFDTTPGSWLGDGVPATTVTRQMRRAAERKESR